MALILTFVILYVYLGYPVALYLLAHLWHKRHTWDESHLPPVTMIISARNEERSIEEKLNNTRNLNYPVHLLKVIVVSDMSTDRTDEIVRSFAMDDLKLLRTDARNGKTAGINQAMKCVDTDIVVFSDANSMYDADAVRRLVRHFSDRSVGYVVGQACYERQTQSSAAQSEIAYWDIETRIKQWESDFSSVVGGDGAIYAIRANLYEQLQTSDINDFVNPLQIIAKGYRGIFDPEAWCVEHAASEYEREFGRKVRIVNRSFNGVLRVPAACNPFQTGRFAVLLISHKILRWFAPFAIALHFLSLLIMAPGTVSLVLLAFYALGTFMAAMGWFWRRSIRPPRLFSIAYYFALVNIASAVGVILRLKGEVISVWDTVRENGSSAPRMAGLVPCTLLLIFVSALFRIFLWIGYEITVLRAIAILIALSIAHAYIGYPLWLALFSRFKRLAVTSSETFQPSVTLLITAYNEEKIIAEKLSNSLSLEYPQDKLFIAVVSDGSTDNTNAIVRALAASAPRISLIAFPDNRGKIAAINDAMQQLQSEIVVLSDANVMFSPMALKELTKHFNDPRVGVVSGKIVLQNDAVSYRDPESLYYFIEHYIQRQEGSTGGLVGADGAMYAIRRSLFPALPNDLVLDDFAISMEIACKGKLVLHAPYAFGIEINTLEVEGELRRKTRIVAGGIQCLMRGIGIPPAGNWLLLHSYISHKLLRWFLGPLTLVLITALSGIYILKPGIIFTLLLQFLSVWLFIALIGQLLPKTRRSSCIALCHYIMMMNLATFWGCYRGFAGKQSVRWRTSW